MTLHADIDDDERLARLEAFLRLRWEVLGPQRPTARRYAKWMQALAVRDATSDPRTHSYTERAWSQSAGCSYASSSLPMGGHRLIACHVRH